jgi:hypothetical protein
LAGLYHEQGRYAEAQPQPPYERALATFEDGQTEPMSGAVVRMQTTTENTTVKKALRRVVIRQLGLGSTPEPPDVSDALALALALANIERTEARFAELGLAVGR